MSPVIKHHSRVAAVALVVAIAVALVACASTRRSCAEIVDPHLKQALFEQLTQENATTWIADQFSATARRAEYTDGTVTLSWLSNDAFLLRFDRDLVEVRQDWQVAIVTLEDITRCFGPPTHYQAAETPRPDAAPFVGISLWYEPAGLIFDSHDVGSAAPFGRVYPLFRRVTLLRRGPLERMLSTHYREGNFPVLRDVRCLRNWPGDLRLITVDSDVCR